jgi:hypothetical protein
VSLQAQALVCLGSGSVLVAATGLLSALRAKKGQPRADTSGAEAGFLILPLLLLYLTVLGSAFSSAPIQNVEAARLGFFHLRLPVLPSVSLLMLYFGAWAYKGIVRSLTYENQPLFTRPGALIFTLAFNTIALGLFLPVLGAPTAAVGAFWMTLLIPAIFVPAGATRSYDDSLEFLATEDPEGSLTAFTLFRVSNLPVGLALGAVWVTFAVGVALASGTSPSYTLGSAAVALSFYAFYWAVLELHTVYSPIVNKIGVLLVFVLLLHVGLPFLLGIIFDAERLFAFSPAGFAAYLPGLLAVPKDLPLLTILLVNLLLASGPLALVWHRYRRMAQIRSTMS